MDDVGVDDDDDVVDGDGARVDDLRRRHQRDGRVRPGRRRPLARRSARPHLRRRHRGRRRPGRRAPPRTKVSSSRLPSTVLRMMFPMKVIMFMFNLNFCNMFHLFVAPHLFKLIHIRGVSLT